MVGLYAQEKPVLAVLDLKPIAGISQDEMSVLVDYLTTAMFETERFNVIDRSQRNTVLKEQSFSLEDCTDESCQVEVGKLLAANQIVIGSIGQIGNSFIINLKRIDVSTSKIINSISRKHKSIDELLDDCQFMASSLSGVKTVETNKTNKDRQDSKQMAEDDISEKPDKEAEPVKEKKQRSIVDFFIKPLPWKHCLGLGYSLFIPNLPFEDEKSALGQYYQTLHGLTLKSLNFNALNFWASYGDLRWGISQYRENERVYFNYFDIGGGGMFLLPFLFIKPHLAFGASFIFGLESNFELDVHNFLFTVGLKLGPGAMIHLYSNKLGLFIEYAFQLGLSVVETSVEVYERADKYGISANSLNVGLFYNFGG